MPSSEDFGVLNTDKMETLKASDSLKVLRTSGEMDEGWKWADFDGKYVRVEKRKASSRSQKL